MGYDKYKDSNGITWSVLWPDRGWSAMATVPDDASPRYEPPATDQEAHTPPPDDVGGGVAAPTGEQQRVLFSQLTSNVEAFAKQNREHALLTVTARPPTPWWVWAVGLWALYEMSRR